MKFVKKEDIDYKKWDELVANSSPNNIFCYSWYLDATAKRWGAILNDDYTFGWPLPYKNRIFFKQIFQHPFTRDLDFFGDQELLPQAEEILKELGKFHIHFPHRLSLQGTKRVYQYLDLTKEIKYKTNAVRILKKTRDKFEFKISENYESLTNFYFSNSFHKIKQPQKNKRFLTQLLKAALKAKKGLVIEAYEGNQLAGAAFYLMDKSTICYLLGDSDKKYKKEGVMFALMDFAIQKYKADFKIFDFGGSNVKSVRDFYQKFGGIDKEYFQYIG